MSEQQHTEKHDEDGLVDAVASLAVIAIIVTAVIYWLAGMP